MIDVCIQHHPSRHHLLDRIRAECPDARVVEDPEPDGVGSSWRTQKRCLLSAGESGHLLVIQDDAIPCPGFLSLAQAAVEQRPDGLVAFFVGMVPKQRARKMTMAVSAGLPWIELDTREWCPTVALAWPVDLARRIMADRRREERRSDDWTIGRWAKLNHVPVWATAPSLVQHIDDQPSVIGKRQASWRTAAAYAGDAGWPGVR